MTIKYSMQEKVPKMQSITQKCNFFVAFGFLLSSAAFAEFCESRNGFQDTPNGCKHRGLVWSGPSDSPMTAVEAASYCTNMPRIDGANKSWRLPSLEEFKAFAESDALSVLKGFDSEQLFWTSTENVHVPQAYFMPNNVSLSIDDASLAFRTICVIQKLPSQISAGAGYTCALEQDGVKCWGKNHLGQINAPKLNRPKQLSTGASVACALDQDGVNYPWACVMSAPFIMTEQRVGGTKSNPSLHLLHCLFQFRFHLMIMAPASLIRTAQSVGPGAMVTSF